MNMHIRQARQNDLSPLLSLYTHLNYNPLPQINAQIQALWENIMSDNNHHIIVGTLDGKIVSSCVLIIIPNLTHGQRPYALIENVVTHADFRKKGCGSAVLDFARKKAMEHDCYKIMLMTGSKKQDTLAFYKKAGYNCEDKTAFIQWL